MNVNFTFRVEPIALTVVMITTEIPAAIRPYSIAVVPDSFFRKARIFDISRTPCNYHREQRRIRSVKAGLQSLVKAGTFSGFALRIYTADIFRACAATEPLLRAFRRGFLPD